MKLSPQEIKDRAQATRNIKRRMPGYPVQHNEILIEVKAIRQRRRAKAWITKEIK